MKKVSNNLQKHYHLYFSKPYDLLETLLLGFHSLVSIECFVTYYLTTRFYLV